MTLHFSLLDENDMVIPKSSALCILENKLVGDPVDLQTHPDIS